MKIPSPPRTKLLIHLALLSFACLALLACRTRAAGGTPTPAPDARPDTCADDACIDGAVVAITPSGSIQPFTSAPVTLVGPTTRTTQTTQDGRFIFSALAPGEYTVSVPDAPGYDFSPSRSNILQKGGRRAVEASHADVAVPPKVEVIFTYVNPTSGLKP